MSAFRDQFDSIFQAGQNPFETDQEQIENSVQWWFKDYKSAVSRKDLLWFCEQVCGQLDPLKTMMERLILGEDHYSKNRSTNKNLRLDESLKAEYIDRLLSLWRFAYNLRVLIAQHDYENPEAERQEKQKEAAKGKQVNRIRQPYPNNIDPHEKCAEYYCCLDLRQAVESGVITDLEQLEVVYQMHKPSFLHSCKF